MDQVVMNPHNSDFDTMRLIGRKFNDPDIRADIKTFVSVRSSLFVLKWP